MKTIAGGGNLIFGCGGDTEKKAAFAWAEAVTRVAETGVPDVEFETASRVFDEKELADLTMAISLMNAYNRLAISFRRTPDAVLAARS